MLHNDDDADADDDGPPAESQMSHRLDHISFWNYSLVLNVSDDTLTLLSFLSGSTDFALL